jgi:hypothetical protein
MAAEAFLPLHGWLVVMLEQDTLWDDRRRQLRKNRWIGLDEPTGISISGFPAARCKRMVHGGRRTSNGAPKRNMQENSVAANER